MLLFCLFGLALWHARTASLTFDEGPHLAAGYAYLRTGDLRLQPVHIHPPLANVLSAAPLLLQSDLPDPRGVDGWDIASLSAVTDAVVWQYPHPARIALAGRFPIILLTLLLGAVIFRWATDLFGPQGGLLALTLYTFDPNIIAHGSLITTDMAVTLWGTLALFLTWRAMRGRVPNRILPLWGAGIAMGLALVSKVSALSLIPALALLWLLVPARSLRSRLWNVAVNLILAALVLWAVYGFELRPVQGIPWPIPAATHIEIYRSLQEHYRQGHPAFLMGENRDHGWWYYFPVAFLLKTPLPTMFLAGASALFALVGSQPHLSARTFTRWSPVLFFPLCYLALTPFSSVNIGYRHLLPILPFLFIGTSGILRCASRRIRRTPRIAHHGLRFAFSLFLLWLALGTLHVAPHDLAFFNELVGGPNGGYRYLVDSNLDWGQNLWELRDWMETNGVKKVFYAHFSPARPQAYGIRADFLPPDPRAVAFTPLNPAPGIYAIGATVLQGVYTPDVNTYAWFRVRSPLIRLGYGLFLYRVDPRPLPRWAVVCVAPAPVLEPDALRAGLGQPDLRVVLADCSQSWAWPGDTGPGVYVLPPEVSPPAGAQLEVAARRPDGSPLYRLYRLETAPVPPQDAPVLLNGPLIFLGARAHPGNGTLDVETWWRVTEGPITRPLSIMGHLLTAKGEVIGQDDGLGISPVVWQPGDIIVQRHQFPQPPAGTELWLRTGAYWLDTMERWPVRGNGISKDAIFVPIGQ
ncbi:MAG: ArnT family glycosyltransferase [Anaerolineae bacterium]